MRLPLPLALLPCAANLILTLPGEAKAWVFNGPRARLVERLHTHSRVVYCAPADEISSSGSARTAPPTASREPEKIGPPRDMTPTPLPSAVAAIASVNPEIDRRLGEWKAVNPSSGPGTMQTVTIQVDGKTVTLEIRVVVSTPGPAPMDTDLAKSLKVTVAKDAAPGAAAQLAELYLHLADILKRRKNLAVNDILTIRNNLLKLATWSEANKLKETNKAIDGFLTDYLSKNHIDVTANLNKDDAAKVSGAFQTIAETLEVLP